MKIYLLTHQREIDRKTNTGLLALEASGGIVERIIWDRINPNKKLINLIESHKAILLYPSSEPNQANLGDFDHFIILDATWQEAKKMFNQSNYLKSVSRLTLPTSCPSQYHLRRNQPQGGLCTLESVIEILKLKNQHQIAEQLNNAFIKFNS